MNSTAPSDSGWPQPMMWLVGIGLVLALLVVGRTILMPLAIAVLAWNLLDTVIDSLSRPRWNGWRLPRWLATLVSLALLAIAMTLVVRILASQVDVIAEQWPQYAERLEQILAQIVAYLGDDVAAQFENLLADLNLADAVSGVLGSAGSLLLSLGLIVLYITFLMVERAHLAKKMVALFPDDTRRREMLRIVLLVAASLRRYLWVKTLTSLLTGVASYIVLRLFAVDFAETWALIIFLLNYIPNIGSFLGVVFPTLLALVQFETLLPVLFMTLFLGSIQILVGNVIEPMLMGRTLNLSTFVIIVSLTVWGAVWGIVGLFLSVPMTVMIMIICAHVPNWRPLAILLSEDGELHRETEQRRRRRLSLRWMRRGRLN
ncbi:MAG: AI-2E family transporter [Wenzhouxiangellaceae bacterium]